MKTKEIYLANLSKKEFTEKISNSSQNHGKCWSSGKLVKTKRSWEARIGAKVMSQEKPG